MSNINDIVLPSGRIAYLILENNEPVSITLYGSDNKTFVGVLSVRDLEALADTLKEFTEKS